jgi:hypothetical protein
MAAEQLDGENLVLGRGGERVTDEGFGWRGERGAVDGKAVKHR